MSLLRTAFSSLVFLPVVACGGAPASAPAAGPSEPAPAVTAPSSASAPAATDAPPARDPKVEALAKKAAACPREEGAFDEECPALRAWMDEEALFADGANDDTILSLLEDPSVAVRDVAIRRGVSNARFYFQDASNAKRIYAIAKKETDPVIMGWVGNYAAYVDADKAGLQSELRGLLQHPSVTLRQRLARYVEYRATPLALEVTRALLADGNREVRRSAISALSSGGITKDAPEVCALLDEQIKRTDDLAGDALWAGSSSKCAGMDGRVIEELEKRVADPKTVQNAVGIGYTLAASGVCSRTSKDELKKRGYAVGLKLSDAKVPDPNTRSAAIDVLKGCDREAAKKALAKLAKDRNKSVAERASKTLAEIDPKAATKK